MSENRDIRVARLEERLSTVQADLARLREAIDGASPGDRSSIRYRIHKLEDDVEELVQEAVRDDAREQVVFTHREKLVGLVFAGLLAVGSIADFVITIISEHRHP